MLLQEFRIEERSFSVIGPLNYPGRPKFNARGRKEAKQLF
jgi:hypothetical protein